MINRHILSRGIDLRLSTELKEIKDNGNGLACGVITNSGEEIECQFVGLTAGVHPNIGFLEGSGIETDRGVLVDQVLRTNIANIYALGDCAQLKEPRRNRRPIEPVWYTGKMMGETVAATICDEPTEYDPGIWYNSAKFFDIEYQTYGYVSAQEKDDESSLYWEDPAAERCVRIVYDSKSKAVVGFNVFGIRLAHRQCDNWLRNATPIDQVLNEMERANFDPEFFRSFENQLREAAKSQLA